MNWPEPGVQEGDLSLEETTLVELFEALRKARRRERWYTTSSPRLRASLRATCVRSD